MSSVARVQTDMNLRERALEKIEPPAIDQFAQSYKKTLFDDSEWAHFNDQGHYREYGLARRHWHRHGSRCQTEVLETIVASIPLRRLGEPSEIASIVSWIAADEAGFATGADFSLNGGVHMG